MTEAERQSDAREGKQIKREARGQCAPASFITALGSELFPPRILPEMGRYTEEGLIYGNMLKEVAEREGLKALVPTSSHEFESLMENIKSRGAVISSEDLGHLTGVRPLLGQMEQ